MSKFVQVPLDEYGRLLDDARMFQALDTLGVDNWDGYEEARNLAAKWAEEDDE